MPQRKVTSRQTNYLWSLIDAQYLYDDEDNTPVPRENVVWLARYLADSTDQILENLVVAFYNGDISFAECERAFQVALKHAYNAELALGAGGWDRVGFDDWGRNGWWLRREYNFLSGFLGDIETGAVRSLNEARARARLYSGRAYSRFWEKDRQYRLTRHKWEWWSTVGDDRVCGDCEALEASGRVPIGTLQTVPGAGDTVCLGNCRCEIGYE